MRIRYLSFGITETGGYRHEKLLFEQLCATMKSKGAVEADHVRHHGLFTSLPAYCRLMLWAWRNSRADIVITGGRAALPALWRNRNTNAMVWVVLHNDDENDGKSGLLKWYYKRLFSLIKKTSSQRCKVIAVSDYWLRYFSEIFGKEKVNLFPNFFEPDQYTVFQKNGKEKMVHLGQWSSKNDAAVFALAERLTASGYYCYFSTLEKNMAGKKTGYDIVYFSSLVEYLVQMSKSICTLALTRINEGWNRVAHESLLTGTPVIGYDRGGLGDLLKESGSIIVQDTEEVYNCIIENKWPVTRKEFIERYTYSNIPLYLNPLCNAR